MKHHHYYLAAVLLLLSVTVASQPMEKWGYPDPDVFGKAVHSLCEEQHLSVMLAAKYRDQGRSKSDVLALIPENLQAYVEMNEHSVKVRIERDWRIFLVPHSLPVASAKVDQPAGYPAAASGSTGQCESR